jgi:hypothetical protein
MKRTLVLSVLTLAVLAGAASADRGHRGHRGHSQRGHASWSGGVHVTTPRARVQRHVVVQQPRRVYVQRNHVVHRNHVVRRPIYVKAPRIRYRYYNYYQRPAVLVENYAPMTGYYWVAGQWSWNGYEWIWMAGHYEPDPAYFEASISF